MRELMKEVADTTGRALKVITPCVGVGDVSDYDAAPKLVLLQDENNRFFRCRPTRAPVDDVEARSSSGTPVPEEDFADAEKSPAPEEGVVEESFAAPSSSGDSFPSLSLSSTKSAGRGLQISFGPGIKLSFDLGKVEKLLGEAVVRASLVSSLTRPAGAWWDMFRKVREAKEKNGPLHDSLQTWLSKQQTETKQEHLQHSDGRARIAALQDLPGSPFSDPREALERVRRDGMALGVLRWWSGDQGVALAAVKQCGHALGHASQELQNNKGVVLAAVKKNGRALKHASKELQGSKAVVLAAVEQSGLALEHASQKLQTNTEVVMVAVANKGGALKFAGKELQGNKGAVLAAVKQDGCALAHAAKELQGHREVVLAAVGQNGCALAHASEQLQGNKEVVLVAVKQNREAWKFADKKLQFDDIRFWSSARIAEQTQ